MRAYMTDLEIEDAGGAYIRGVMYTVGKGGMQAWPLQWR